MIIKQKPKQTKQNNWIRRSTGRRRWMFLLWNSSASQTILKICWRSFWFWFASRNDILTRLAAFFWLVERRGKKCTEDQIGIKTEDEGSPLVSSFLRVFCSMAATDSKTNKRMKMKSKRNWSGRHDDATEPESKRVSTLRYGATSETSGSWIAGYWAVSRCLHWDMRNGIICPQWIPSSHVRRCYFCCRPFCYFLSHLQQSETLQTNITVKSIDCGPFTIHLQSQSFSRSSSGCQSPQRHPADQFHFIN